MRKAETIEKLYLDFDGFFASVMQQALPKLRGKPVGIIPFETSAANSTVVIACSKEAKAAGCKNVMPVRDARALCPNIILVTQRPDLFRRAHNALLNEIACEIPIETVKSIDELACKLDKSNIENAEGLAQRIKQRIKANIGEQITCSIGFAANRLLAKIACKVDKPNGVTSMSCAFVLNQGSSSGNQCNVLINPVVVNSSSDNFALAPYSTAIGFGQLTVPVHYMGSNGTIVSTTYTLPTQAIDVGACSSSFGVCP